MTTQSILNILALLKKQRERKDNNFYQMIFFSEKYEIY
jgi:hypothetical protein